MAYNKPNLSSEAALRQYLQAFLSKHKQGRSEFDWETLEEDLPWTREALNPTDMQDAVMELQSVANGGATLDVAIKNMLPYLDVRPSEPAMQSSQKGRYDDFDPVYRARVRKGMTPTQRFLETGNAVGSNFYELNVRDKTLEEPLSAEEIARKAASRTEDNTKYREYLGPEQEDPLYQRYLGEAKRRIESEKLGKSVGHVFEGDQEYLGYIHDAIKKAQNTNEPDSFKWRFVGHLEELIETDYELKESYGSPERFKNRLSQLSAKAFNDWKSEIARTKRSNEDSRIKDDFYTNRNFKP